MPFASELALSISPDAGRCDDALAALVALDVPMGLVLRSEAHQIGESCEDRNELVVTSLIVVPGLSLGGIAHASSGNQNCGPTMNVRTSSTGTALHSHSLDGVMWQANAGPNSVTKSHTFNDHQGNWSTNLSGSATCA